MLNLIPYPSGPVQENEGVCRIPENLTADLGDFARWAVIAFENRMRRPLAAGSWLRLFRDPAKAPEGYTLSITAEGVRIGASTEQGVIWGLATLYALKNGDTLPCCLIQDAPRYGHRGLNLDCSRHFFPAEEVKKIIEALSLCRMNVLHWHLSDDQGWRIESLHFPKLTKASKQFYTQRQIREIVEFARLRGVEIIPEIDMPGHTSAVLNAYPKFGCFGTRVPLADHGGIFPVILCPGKDETMSFLEELLEEIIPLFPGPRFHIGGDEAPKSEWKQCPDCAARKEQLGLTEDEDLQGWFTARIAEILRRHGKTPICWDDTLLASNAPREIQVQYWMLTHRRRLEQFIRDGGKWIYSDMLDFYFDYPYSMTPLKKVYTASPRLGKREAAGDPNLLGLECCLWTEYVTTPEQLEKRLFPRVYAFAEAAWGTVGKYEDFLTRLEALLPARGHAVTAKTWWDPRGTARRKEALAFVARQRAASADEEPPAEPAPPNREFDRAYRKKFFKPWDAPWLR